MTDNGKDGVLTAGTSVEASKRTNGPMDGEANVQKFLAWQAGVDDFKPFVRQGTLSRSAVAREVGLNRDVLYTNPVIRDQLWPDLLGRLEREGVLKSRVAQPARVVIRGQKRSPADEARMKQTQEENEALKAENRELRKQLERYEGIAEVLHTTGRLPW